MQKMLTLRSLRQGSAALLQQYVILLAFMLAEYRRTWFFHLIRGALFPLAFLFLTTFTEKPDTQQVIFLMGGTLTTALAFGPMSALINKLGQGRQFHEFDYWLTLPIAPLMLVFAIMSIALFFAFPGLIITYLLSCVFLHFPVVSGLMVLPFLPLGALSLAGFAASIGSYAPNAQIAALTGNVMTLLIGFFSPMFIPLSSMPPLLRLLAYCLPFTYLADAFRAIMEASYGLNFLIDIIVLFLCIAICMFLIQRKIDWRSH